MPASASRSAIACERGVPHVRAGPVAEDEQVARVRGPDQQGGDLALLRRGDELQLSGIAGHVRVSPSPHRGEGGRRPGERPTLAPPETRRTFGWR